MIFFFLSLQIRPKAKLQNCISLAPPAGAAVRFTANRGRGARGGRYTAQYPVCLLACLSPDKNNYIYIYLCYIILYIYVCIICICTRAQGTTTTTTPGTITIKNNDLWLDIM